MKRKVLSAVLCAAMATSLFAGCGGGSGDTAKDTSADNAATDDAAAGDDAAADDAAGEDLGEEGTEVQADAVSTVGPDSGTHMEMWSFVELHNNFYAKMLEKWNEENPDRQIQITFTTYPFADMHNKLIMALQTGDGAPDLCDIERGQFPNFLQGEPQLYALNDALAPYQADLVESRFDIYAKDGTYYGAPTHVGATVMYYNDELLQSFGVDYTTIKTWDDYTAAAEKVKEASNGEVTMTSVDTGGTDWLWVAMAEHGEDYTDADGKVTVPASWEKMLTMQQGWINDGLAVVSPDGQLDTEGGRQIIMDQKIASFPKALWYMSRFLSYSNGELDTMDAPGKWAIAPCPVFEEGQPRSVGIGGTGTVVTNQSADPALAAEFISYAKCSYEGCVGIWEELGFDVCNTSVWADEKITKDTSNQYISFFKTNPFDVLNEIKEEIGAVTVNSNVFILQDYINVNSLNAIMEDGQDVAEALQEAQDAVDLEQ
ncbi:MAG: ABC transporter substrate-binding protein [Lachnospiraceae bacterium]|nr:ABC transporter substrate-binding protein [Lachnospiraceae bacterium]MDE6982518.1 ABC transporter substrate-binding protein [Lachnospiraceae bacterium]